MHRPVHAVPAGACSTSRTAGLVLDGRAAWSVMLARGARVGNNVIRAVRGRVRTAKL